MDFNIENSQHMLIKSKSLKRVDIRSISTWMEAYNGTKKPRNRAALRGEGVPVEGHPGTGSSGTTRL